MTTKTLAVSLHLPRPHDAQQRVIAEAQRFNVVCCGRRWGKTVLGVDRIIEPALQKFPVAWFSPTYKMLTETWREVRRAVAPVVSRVSEQEHRLEIIGGGVIEMWSLDAPDSARGRKYKRVVIDEAAMIPHLQEAWEGAVRPTLTDYQGDAWFLSTPRGYNYFKELYDRGFDRDQEDWASWRMPTSTNPYIDPLEIAAAQRDLPIGLFAQEYLASFEANADGRFNLERVNDALIACRDEMTNVALPAGLASPYVHIWSLPRPGVPYVAYTESAEGKGRDYTVTYIAEARTLRVVAGVRENVLEPGMHAALAEKLCRAFNNAFWGVERNRGEAVLYVVGQLQYPRVYWHQERTATLQQKQKGVEPTRRLGFPVTEQTRFGLIDDLAQVIEDRSLECDDPVFWRECQSFVYNERGRPEAAPGTHDDTVMCMAGLVRMARQPGATSLRVEAEESPALVQAQIQQRQRIQQAGGYVW